MGETVKTEKTPKKSWSAGLKAEFRKVIWPDKKSITRQTIAVTAVSIVLGLIIAIFDSVIKYGIDFLVSI
jgi:preprotein translocase subunit SecE